TRTWIPAATARTPSSATSPKRSPSAISQRAGGVRYRRSRWICPPPPLGPELAVREPAQRDLCPRTSDQFTPDGGCDAAPLARRWTGIAQFGCSVQRGLPASVADQC